MTSGEIVLTFPATCSVCRAQVPLGRRVWWDAGTSEISCVGEHLGGGLTSYGSTREPSYPPNHSTPSTQSTGRATGRAHGEAPAPAPTPRRVEVFDQDIERSATRRTDPWGDPSPERRRVPTLDGPEMVGAHAVAHHGGVGRRRGPRTTVVSAGHLPGLPPAVRRTALPIPPLAPWHPGRLLLRAVGRAVVVLDHRTGPGLTRPIEHVIVAETGVWVVGTIRSGGAVERRIAGPMTSASERLVVNGHDRTRSVRSALAKADTVAGVMARLGPGWSKVPVHAVVCLPDTEWYPFSQALSIDGVLVLLPKQLGAGVLSEPLISARSVEVLASHLDAHLTPAR